ncbi:hypothetical protein BT67DRAFT_343245, partial [Trichocladium antarcticum]
MWRKKYYQDPRRLALAAIAKETKETTSTIAAGLPHLSPMNSEKLDLETLPDLDPTKCPRFRSPTDPSTSYGTTVRVFNQDSFDAAIGMPSVVLTIPASTPRTPTQAADAEALDHLKASAASPENLDSCTAARVAVLNMASETKPGGGWLKGTSAQEEALCYRSTLAASLHRKLYPIAPRAGLYTRDVVVLRESHADGHSLMVPETDLRELPVLSALTVAGIRRPEVKGKAAGDVGVELAATEPVTAEEKPRTVAALVEEDAATETAELDEAGTNDARGKQWKDGKNKGRRGPLVFADPAARDLTKDKMRLCLRMAATKGHAMLVLGAIGCGAFGNPPHEIVACWSEVLGESEFAGGWFKEIWFAVFDRRNEGNFEVFRDVFDGKVV